jgi:uncharacterized membrane protein SpoIIM required for sporulation
MKQEAFLARHAAEWTELGAWLDRRGAPRPGARKPPHQAPFDDIEFPARYRRACQQLALARRRGYSPLVLEPLAQLVRRGHTVLYRAPHPRLARVLRFFGADYPRLVRRHWRYVALAAVLLFVPFFAMLVLVQLKPELALSVLDYTQLAEFERMYDPADPGNALGREGGTNLQMFGFYVLNNITIGFRTFASGLVACVGAIAVLVSNGVMFGTIAGHLTAVGHGGPFWRFVPGHSAPELGAIVLSGAAGLRVGWALLAPGRLSRPRALVEAGSDGGALVLGVFVLLLFAAFVEAYWSSIGWMPGWIKYAVGLVGWIALVYWLLRGGRGQADAP